MQHMETKENAERTDARASPGWERWKKDIKDNSLGFLLLAIWMAMGIPVIYLALLFR